MLDHLFNWASLIIRIDIHKCCSVYRVIRINNSIHNIEYFKRIILNTVLNSYMLNSTAACVPYYLDLYSDPLQESCVIPYDFVRWTNIVVIILYCMAYHFVSPFVHIELKHNILLNLFSKMKQVLHVFDYCGLFAFTWSQDFTRFMIAIGIFSLLFGKIFPESINFRYYLFLIIIIIFYELL